MINRRRVMGGESLPYGAKKIEYLENGGNAYIETGITPSVGDILRIMADIQYASNVRSNSWLTGWYLNDECSSLFGTFLNQIYFTYDKDYKIARTSTGLYDRHLIKYNYDGIWIDNILIDNTIANNTKLTSVYPGVNLSIFRRYGGIEIGFFAKVFMFKVQINDNILFDAIPVRVGSTGYLYDKVSKQLFGNAGTGAFVLGPDI